MKKLIFLPLIFFLINTYLAFVLADADTNIGSYLFKDNGSVDRFGSTINVADLLNTHGWVRYKVGSDSTTDDGDYQTFTDGTRAIRVVGEAAKNKAYAGNWTNSSAPYKNATFFAIVSKTAGGNTDGGFGMINVTSGRYIYLNWNSVSGPNTLIWSPNSPAWSDCNGLTAISADETTGAVWNITFYTNGTYLGCSFNSTPCATNCSFAAAGFTGDNPLIFDGVFLTASQANTFLFGDVKAFNGTTLPQVPPPAPDTNPPEITYFNLTNENGCENWNTNKSNVCSTSSVTPTVQFNTSENAWCAISGNFSSTLGRNYTEMGSARNCTGNASGEGTRFHLCTLINPDELVYDTSYIYISCKDASDNMNRSGASTSGTLKVSITGLEAAGRNSIGLGIQNALLSSYTNYTDLQIYARNLSNAQVRGTFDRAVKKGSKMWAFNRIGVSDSYVNMFNLTPVLYTLELTNKTSSNITLQVEQLINTTK